MASLRQQAKEFDAVFAKTAKKAAKAGQRVNVGFGGQDKHAAYRGAVNKEMRRSGDSELAHKAGLKAEKAHFEAKKRINSIEEQFAKRRGKKADAEKAALIKEASAGLSPTKS